MNTIVFSFAVISLLAIVACSSSEVVTSTGQGPYLSLDELNQRVRSRQVTILFNDGSQTQVEGFQTDHDSVSWSGSTVKLPITRIHSISTDPDRLLGGVIGFGTGACVGGLVGWQVAQGMKTSGESGDVARGLFAGAAVGVGGGIILGTIIGTVIVKRNVYEFKNVK